MDDCFSPEHEIGEWGRILYEKINPYVCSPGGIAQACSLAQMLFPPKSNVRVFRLFHPINTF